MQKDTLKAAGCHTIFEDKISSTKMQRAGLDKAAAALREADVLVVWKLGRLGRSLKHLVETVFLGIGFHLLHLRRSPYCFDLR